MTKDKGDVRDFLYAPSPPFDIKDMIWQPFCFQSKAKTRPTHRRTDANLYPQERQLTKASEPSFDLEGGAQGKIRPHNKIPSPLFPIGSFTIPNL